MEISLCLVLRRPGPCTQTKQGGETWEQEGSVYIEIIAIYYHYQSIEPPQRYQLITMRTNQEDRPGVSDLPPPDIEKQVQKLAKRKLEAAFEIAQLMAGSS